MKSMQILFRCLTLIVGITLLNACAAGKLTKNPSKIRDDGKRNTVLISYDINLEVVDRYHTVKSTTLDIRCNKDNSSLAHTCFAIRLPFGGLKQGDGEYVYHSFSNSGAAPYQIKYGEYSINRMFHNIMVGIIPRDDCEKNRKGRLRCRTIYEDSTKTHSMSLESPVPFTVGSGKGCYLGHLTLHLRNSKVVKYNFDRAFNEKMIDRVDDNLRDSVRANLAGTCVETAS